MKGESAEMPQRTRTAVRANREKDPGGCFVAEEDRRVVGFIFSRTWGSVGWFGPSPCCRNISDAGSASS